MRTRATKTFAKAVRKLDPTDIGRVFDAVTRFTIDPSHPGLNFEPVTGKPGVHTIRATLALRIFLRQTEEDDLYDLADIGQHDLYR